MKKVYRLIPITIIIFTILFSCSNDDDNGAVVVPPRERDEEVIPATLMIEKYLETHFYNYEEFENPPVDFNYRIKFDTISGDNSSKTPLMNQVSFKYVDDLFADNVTYKLYFLNTIQGEGERVEFTDYVTMNYVGMSLNEKEVLSDEDLDGNGALDDYITVYPTNVFDSTANPIRLGLTQVVKGFQAGVIEFNGATSFTENSDGTLDFEEYGVGAVFMQSGLGYYNIPPIGSPVEYYDQLIFTFETFSREKSDIDLDTILSSFEDLNGNGNELDDDTDGDGFPNFNDPDDDGDGRLTKYEVVAKEYVLNPGDPDPEFEENEVEMQRKILDGDTGVVTLYTVVFTDANNDGIPDYLDKEL